MSQVATCLTCGSKSKIKNTNREVTYKAVQNEESFQKIGQLKKAMEKFKAKAEQHEKELQTLKSKGS